MGLLIHIVHLLAAVFWVGGAVTLTIVAVPTITRLQGAERAASLRTLGRRWRVFGWGSLVLALATGLAAAAQNHAFHAHRLFHTEFGIVLLIKSFLVVLLVAAAAAHDFWLGPRLSRQLREGRPPTARPPLVLVGRLSLLLALAVPVLGVVVSQLLHD